MLRQMAWNIFKNTGDINTFLELKQVQDIEENETKNIYDIGTNKIENTSVNGINSMGDINNINGEINGNSKNQRDSNTRK